MDCGSMGNMNLMPLFQHSPLDICLIAPEDEVVQVSYRSCRSSDQWDERRKMQFNLILPLAVI